MLRHLVRARGAVRHHARSAAPATSAASLQPRWYEPPKLSDTIRYAATNAAVNAALVSAAASNLAAASSGVGEGVDAAIGAAVLLGGAAAYALTSGEEPLEEAQSQIRTRSTYSSVGGAGLGVTLAPADAAGLGVTIYDGTFPKLEGSSLSPQAYLALDLDESITRAPVRYLLKLGDGDLAKGRLESAQRGVLALEAGWDRQLWRTEEREPCPEKNRESGIFTARAFSKSQLNTLRSLRMLGAATEIWLGGEDGVKISQERLELLQVMVDLEYLKSDDESLAPYESVGPAVEGTGLGAGDAMLVDQLHALCFKETRDAINWKKVFGAGCFFGEETLSAAYMGLITFDDAGHCVEGPHAILRVGEQIAVATRIFTHDVRDVVTYVQEHNTAGARLAVRFMAMTDFGNRQTSPWFLLTASDAWAAGGSLQYAGSGSQVYITDIERSQKTSEYVLGLVADTYYSNAGGIVGLEDGVAENPDHLQSVMSIVSTIFNSNHDFAHRIQNGNPTKLREHPRLMTPREVAAAERMGITPSRDNEWPDWLLRTLRRERPAFMRSGGYEQLKMWPYWLIWITIDCLSLWSGIVFEMVALDNEGRVVERARPAPFVHETSGEHFLEWGAAPQTLADLDSFVDLDDEANRPTFLSVEALREALDIGKSNQQKHAEGIGGVCLRHINSKSCQEGVECKYAFHYGHKDLGPFYKIGDKCDEDDTGKWCKVCGARWNVQKRCCSDAETCPGGTFDKYHAIRKACDEEKKPYPAWWRTGFVPDGGVKFAPHKVDAVRALTGRERRALEPTYKQKDRVKIIQEGHEYQGRLGKVTKKTSNGRIDVRLDPVAGETVPVTLKQLCLKDLVHVADAVEGAEEEKKEEAGGPAAMEED